MCVCVCVCVCECVCACMGACEPLVGWLKEFFLCVCVLVCVCVCARSCVCVWEWVHMCVRVCVCVCVVCTHRSVYQYCFCIWCTFFVLHIFIKMLTGCCLLYCLLSVVSWWQTNQRANLCMPTDNELVMTELYCICPLCWQLYLAWLDDTVSTEVKINMNPVLPWLILSSAGAGGMVRVSCWHCPL